MKKPKIKYYLKAKDKNPNNRTKEELVQARIHNNFIEEIDNTKKYYSFFVSLQATIKPKNFGLLKDNFRFNEDIFNNFSKQNKGVKTAMQLFEKKVDELYTYYQMNDIKPTTNQFKNDLLVKLDRKQRETQKQVSLLGYISNKVTEFESLKGSGRKNAIDENSIKVYRTLRTYIDKYERITSKKLTFQNFDEATYWDFWDKLDQLLKGKITIEQKEGERKQNIKPNGFLMTSIRKYQKALIRVFKLAISDKITTNLNINDINLILDDKPASKDIYINEDNLLKLYNHKPTNKGLELAKDYVLLASLTGMRFESMEIAHETNIAHYSHDNYNFKYLHSFQNKTHTECYIPLFEPVQKILSKHNNRFPKFPVNQILNRELKELFKEANIIATSIVETHTYKSGVIKETKNISELISSHDCRKSFVTNLGLKNASENIVLSVTHPDKKPSNVMINVYDKASLMDKAKQFVDEVNKANKQKQSQLYYF